MATWSEVLEAAPGIAARARERFTARRHHTLATLRRDGSPRISGIEVDFHDGAVVLGMMPGSVKALDLLRDPRLALHSASDDPTAGAESEWPGDAKLAGRAVALPPRDGALRFAVDVTELVVTSVGTPADHLVIESWHADRGLRRRIRR